MAASLSAAAALFASKALAPSRAGHVVARKSSLSESSPLWPIEPPRGSCERLLDRHRNCCDVWNFRSRGRVVTDIIWTGNTSSEWRNSGNWSPEQVPQKGDAV